VKRERMFRIGAAGVIGSVMALGAVPSVSAVAKIHPAGVVLQQSDGTPIADATVTIDFDGQKTTARTGPDGVLPIVLVAEGGPGVGKVVRTGDGKVRLIGDGSGRITWVGGPVGGQTFAAKDGELTVDVPVELERVPTARDPWAILQQTPGVLIDRINVGDMSWPRRATRRHFESSGRNSSRAPNGRSSRRGSWGRTWVPTGQIIAWASSSGTSCPSRRRSPLKIASGLNVRGSCCRSLRRARAAWRRARRLYCRHRGRPGHRQCRRRWCCRRR
jgi:hypothetical protein